MRRTQHASFAVGPSHATRNGLSYVASRVCPSGKLATEPSVIHAWPARPRTGPKMYPMIGIPASVAATALSPAPSVNKNPRRDGGDGGRESWCPHIASGSSRPAWDRRPFRDEPGDDVGDLRRR